MCTIGGGVWVLVRYIQLEAIANNTRYVYALSIRIVGH